MTNDLTVLVTYVLGVLTRGSFSSFANIEQMYHSINYEYLSFMVNYDNHSPIILDVAPAHS